MNSLKRQIASICFIFIFLMTACSSQTSTPGIVDVEQSVSTLPIAIQASTSTPHASTDPIENTMLPAAVSTNTAVPTPTDVLALIGTPLSNSPQVIDANNYANLKRIAQWGRGSIQGIGFAPDGKSFVVISELGWSIYRMDALDKPPQWVGFDQPILFREFYFNRDGTAIQFTSSTGDSTTAITRSFPSAETNKKGTGAAWLKPNIQATEQGTAIKSPDGTKVFKSKLVYEFNQNIFSDEKTIREMYEANGGLVYSLRDDAPYVAYSDRHGPEGCDLSVFSPCGNALLALATTPEKVLFSSDGGTFTALYDPPSLSGRMKAFSYIRIYNSSNGDLVGSIGGFTKPVQDFDYSPDGKLLVVGFVDGSIILWDIANATSIYGARHMNAPAWRVEYSRDSRYLLIQRAEELEVRLTANGSLLYRFDVTEFAVSPNKNRIALGDDKGNIQIRDLDSGKGILSIKAHDDRIHAVAFSPDGLHLASAGQDCDIKLWDLATGKLLHYFEETVVDPYEIGMSSRIFSTYLEFIPNKNMLIGFGSWGTVVNWNVNSGATNYVIQSDALEYYNGMITLKPHFPEYFDVNIENGSFYINENGFNLDTGEKLGVYKPPEGIAEGCAPVGPVSSDGKLMFTRGYESREGKICILDAGTFNLLNEIYVMPESETHIPWVDWLYLSPDGRQLIVTVGSGIVYVYQIV